MIRTVKKANNPRIFKNIEGVSLTAVASDVLVKHARILSEGLVQQNVGGKCVYSGSTMLTIDLTKFQSQFRSGAARQQLVKHLGNSLFFKLAVLRLARKEAENRCRNGLLCEVRTELEFKIEQDLLLVDIDVLGDVQAKTAEDFGHGEV
ncbi:MAG: hypothetical protein JXR76_01110 [Deltaproteobacteria bacterium]|nr:hypothetical protein [Deltaproteobacteria bacterium]